MNFLSVNKSYIILCIEREKKILLSSVFKLLSTLLQMLNLNEQDYLGEASCALSEVLKICPIECLFWWSYMEKSVL